MKRFLLCVIITAITTVVMATNDPSFLIGAFSQYQLRYTGSNYLSDFSDLAGKMRDANYNSVVFSMQNNSNTNLDDFPKLAGVLGILAGDNDHPEIKTILNDQTWLPDNYIGAGALCYGNRIQMEAEYKYMTLLENPKEVVFKVDELGDTQEQEFDDALNYVFRHDTGVLAKQAEMNRPLSNQHAWVCDSDSGHVEGIALSQPTKRWLMWGKQFPLLLGRDFRFKSGALSGNRMYLTVALRFEGVPQGAPVADIKLKFLKPSIDPNYVYDPYGNLPASYLYEEKTLTPVDGASYGASITPVDTLYVQRDGWRNFMFEYYIDLDQVLSSSSPYLDHAKNDIYHICPEVYWHGTGKLIIDYIILEDEYSRSVRLDGDQSLYAEKLMEQLDRINDADPHMNILYQLGLDEPRPGQIEMFRLVQDIMSEHANQKDLFTVTNLYEYGTKKHNNEFYDHHKLFLDQADPDRISANIYPLGGTINWNAPNNSNDIQPRIDGKLHQNYHQITRDVLGSNNPDMNLIYIPQTFGVILTATGEWSWHMPPRSMVKCLKFMPLCYAADGTVDFCLASNPSLIEENGNWVTPLSHHSGNYNYDNLEITPNVSAYNYIAEANDKIAEYGRITKPLTWLNANRIMPSGVSAILKDANGIYQDDINLSNVYLSDLRVTNTDGYYQGYVQCGYYTDSSLRPSFMLVNRRAVYRLPDAQVPADASIQDVDLFYCDADSQAVRFTTAASAKVFFGYYLALYDPYDSSLCRGDTLGIIPVPIGPGDGRLMQMCCTLPSIVENPQTMSHLVYLCDQITLADCAQVSISAGTDTHVMANTSIHIPEGCSFTFRGTVDFGDNISIYVEPGGSLSFEDAVCTWGKDSIIEIENATLSATGCSWYTEADTTIWCGIRASASSDITLNDVVISNAYYNSVNNSNLEVTNCRFNVPADGFGLLISNTTEGYTTRITNNESGQGFFGNTYQNSRGIVLGSTKDPVIIDTVYFNNLMTGIWKNSNVSVRDSITGCTFSNCNTGTNIISSDYAGLIESCNFNQTVQDSTAAGIRLIAANPRISECDFTTHRGILTEYCIDTFSRDSGVFDCDFIGCDTGIESRGSNHRLERNYFNYPDYGIVCHAKSNLNLQDTANNVLISQESNIKFFDEQPYEAWIQLFKGHNDFYHLDQGDGTPAIDFEFDPQYFGYPLSLNNKINASRNWFQDMLVTVNDPLYADNVYVDSYDPEPNMPAPPPENDRFFTALGLESQGQYDQALELFKAILNSPLEPELRHLASAADGVYRLTELINDPTWDPTVYFDAKALQYETEDPSLSGLLEEYQAKSYIVRGDYQSAIDLIQLRLDYPTSEVDSLLAVLDLEIVLQLAALEEDKKPLITKYTQYRYPDIQTFKTNHELHWDQLRNLSYRDPDAIPVPSVPVISRNYPNPFNPSTTIEFSVPQKARVKLNVYNIRGQKVKILINGELERGYHKIVWDGRDGTNRNVSSGIYFIRLESDGKTNIRKVMLMK